MLAPFHTLRPTSVQTVSSIPVRKEVKEEEEEKKGRVQCFPQKYRVTEEEKRIEGNFEAV